MPVGKEVFCGKWVNGNAENWGHNFICVALT